MERLQSVEQRLNEEVVELRESNGQLEFEKCETTAQWNAFVEDHATYVERMESKFKDITVNSMLNLFVF